jgi:hypothetical protein
MYERKHTPTKSKGKVIVCCFALVAVIAIVAAVCRGDEPKPASPLGDEILSLLRHGETLEFSTDPALKMVFVKAYDGKWLQEVGGPAREARKNAIEALRTVRTSSEAWPHPIPARGTPEAEKMHEAIHAAHQKFFEERRAKSAPPAAAIPDRRAIPRGDGPGYHGSYPIKSGIED